MTMKATLQAELDSGRIASKQKLFELAISLGLTVTRNGRDYIGLRSPDGKRFRVRFRLLSNSLSTKMERRVAPVAEIAIRTAGYWIYALVAHSENGDRKACYIGQTVHLKRRFREHLRRKLLGRASSALFEWAARESAEVRAAVLSFVDGDQHYATRLEGYWLKLAIEANFEVPNVHTWGRLPQTENLIDQPSFWPASDVIGASLPLSELVEQDITPVKLFVASRVQL